jgi:hypothetical protein
MRPLSRRCPTSTMPLLLTILVWSCSRCVRYCDTLNATAPAAGAAGRRTWQGYAGSNNQSCMDGSSSCDSALSSRPTYPVTIPNVTPANNLFHQAMAGCRLDGILANGLEHWVMALAPIVNQAAAGFAPNKCDDILKLGLYWCAPHVDLISGLTLPVPESELEFEFELELELESEPIREPLLMPMSMPATETARKDNVSWIDRPIDFLQYLCNVVEAVADKSMEEHLIVQFCALVLTEEMQTKRENSSLRVPPLSKHDLDEGIAMQTLYRSNLVLGVDVSKLRADYGFTSVYRGHHFNGADKETEAELPTNASIVVVFDIRTRLLGSVADHYHKMSAVDWLYYLYGFVHDQREMLLTTGSFQLDCHTGNQLMRVDDDGRVYVYWVDFANSTSQLRDGGENASASFNRDPFPRAHSTHLYSSGIKEVLELCRNATHVQYPEVWVVSNAVTNCHEALMHEDLTDVQYFDALFQCTVEAFKMGLSQTSLSAISLRLGVTITNFLGDLEGQIWSQGEEIATLKSDNTMLKSDNTMLKSDNTMLKSENASQDADIVTLKSDNTMLKSDNTMLKSDNVELKASNTAQDAAIAALQSSNMFIQLQIDGILNSRGSQPGGSSSVP